MKKLIFSILGIFIIFSAAGCAENKSTYRTPDDCCIVSVPTGFELWTNEAETFKKVETPIKGMQREENKNYYSVTKDASFSIINFDSYVCDSDTNGQGKLVTGFEVDGNILPYSPSEHNDVTLSCNKDTDILPVYEDYKTVGFITFIADDDASLYECVFNFYNFFNPDGSAKEVENFYYLIQYEHSESLRPYFKTNMNETYIMFTNYSATYTVERVTLKEGQQMVHCILNRYNQTEYFIYSPVYGDDNSAMGGMTIEIGKDYELTVNFEN